MNVKAIVLFLVLFATIALHLPEGMLSGFGFNPNLLIAFVIALGVTILMKEAHIGLAILVVILNILANMPLEDYVKFGFDREIIIASLIVLVLSPIIYRFFDN